jgi:hypothetical protein
LEDQCVACCDGFGGSSKRSRIRDRDVFGRNGEGEGETQEKQTHAT